MGQVRHGSATILNLSEQLMSLHKQIRWYEDRLKQVAKEDERVGLLRTIPGVGAVTASAIIASIGDGHQFRNGREFAAWLGLTPANKSSGGKEKLGRITKMGDQYLRSLLVVGIPSLVRQTRSPPERASKWLTTLLERKPARVATRTLQPPRYRLRRKEYRDSKTRDMMVHKSAAKTRTPRRMSRAS